MNKLNSLFIKRDFQEVIILGKHKLNFLSPRNSRNHVSRDNIIIRENISPELHFLSKSLELLKRGFFNNLKIKNKLK